MEFGSRRSALRRWPPRALLGCLVLATVAVVVIRAMGHHGGPTEKAAPPPPPLRITTVGHPLLGVTAGWELFARGPDDMVRIELAQGRITQTYVPPLQSASPAVAFVIGAHEAVIRPSDLVPGYVVPDNGQAQPLTGLFANGGPLVPGPGSSQAAWVTSGTLTSPALSLMTLTGHRSGPVIRFQPDGPQVAATAVSDGRGDVLVRDSNSGVYDSGPGWDRPVPGTVMAVGARDWLVDVCVAQYRNCHNEVIDATTGSQQALPGPAVTGAPYYPSWPPTGVISPDGSTAAVAEYGQTGQLTVHLVDLTTGTTRDLNLPLGVPGNGLASDGELNEQSMVWSPDGRWLFVAASGGRLVAVNSLTDRAQSLGVRLPAVDQVAIRT